MAFNKVVPAWHATGVEPPDTLKQTGFEGGYRPPAVFFNWFWTGVSEALTELQGHNALKTYTALDQLGLTPGSETIAGIVGAMDDNSMLQMGVGSGFNMGQYPNSGYGTLVVFKKNNGRTMLLYSYTNTEDFGFYYGSYYNASGNEKWTGWISFLPSSGGTVTGDLDFQEHDNGHGGIYKNHSETNDFGMVINDEDANGNTAKLNVCAASNDAAFYGNDNKRKILYGEHNHDLLKTNIAHNQRLYTDLTQIGLTVGSETISDIAKNLPSNSRLVIPVGSTNNMAIYPNSNYGLLVVEKTLNTRIIFTFTNNSGVQWIAAYAINSSGDTWTDWAMVYNSKFLTSGTDDLVDGSTALTNGRLHVVYEEA